MNKTFFDKHMAPILGAVLFVVIVCLSIPGFTGELFAVVKEVDMNEFVAVIIVIAILMLLKEDKGIR
jgi:hypothetical protein